MEINNLCMWVEAVAGSGLLAMFSWRLRLGRLARWQMRVVYVLVAVLVTAMTVAMDAWPRV